VWRTVLFDLDGTLVDSAPSIIGSFEAALAQEGIRPAVALDSSLIGPPLRQTLRQLVGVDDDILIERLAGRFQDAYDTIGYRRTLPYADVAVSLHALRAAGMKLFIVTNKRALPTAKIIQFLGWGDLFEGSYSLDSLTPAAQLKADLVRHILCEHRLVADHTCLVGDTVADAEAARENRLNFYGVAWGYGVFPDRADAEFRMLSDPAELVTLLGAFREVEGPRVRE
jgi:phosphoglycolate phosphatase